MLFFKQHPKTRFLWSDFFQLDLSLLRWTIHGIFPVGQKTIAIPIAGQDIKMPKDGADQNTAREFRKKVSSQKKSQKN